MYIDSHCHINFPELAARMPEILAKMAENQVTHALCVSVDLPDFPGVLALAEQYPHIYASVGVHPDYEDTPEPTVQQLVELADHPKIVAIGETGLDYYRLEGDLEWQRERFRTHIRASRETRKPLIIHTRSASEDTIRILQEEGAGVAAGGVAGVMHCFTESLAVAEAGEALLLAGSRAEDLARLRAQMDALEAVAKNAESTFERQQRLVRANAVSEQVLDDARHALARDYLRQRDLSLTDIAFLLGYQEQSAFTHAFREWSGLNPGAWRERALAGTIRGA